MCINLTRPAGSGALYARRAQAVRRLSRTENPYIPASIATTNMRTCQCGVKIIASAGPGQIPAIPHPTPNIRLPPTKRASNCLFTGNCMGASSKDRLCLRAQFRGTTDTMIAPNITSASEGSQAPATSRKANTLAGFAMPAKSRPRPKSSPARNAVNLIIFTPPADGG